MRAKVKRRKMLTKVSHTSKYVRKLRIWFLSFGANYWGFHQNHPFSKNAVAAVPTLLHTNLILTFHSVALSQYSSGVQTSFALNRYANKRQILYAIDQLELLGGPTYTGEALRRVRLTGFSTESGGRRGAPKVTASWLFLIISVGSLVAHTLKQTKFINELCKGFVTFRQMHMKKTPDM